MPACLLLGCLLVQELAKNIAAVTSSKLQRDRSLSDEGHRHWEQIASTRYAAPRHAICARVRVGAPVHGRRAHAAWSMKRQLGGRQRDSQT